jgi:inosine triphosphate pyrophosphatase
MTLTKINFITGNKNKLTEVRAILGSVIEVDNQAVEVPEIQGTIEEIAKEKARRAAEAVNISFFILTDNSRKLLIPLDQWPSFD